MKLDIFFLTILFRLKIMPDLVTISSVVLFFVFGNKIVASLGESMCLY